MESSGAGPVKDPTGPAGGKKILNSWKQISWYLGRGVRTVQRWERELGLPVRRPRGRPRSAVFALTAEIDAWLKRQSQLDSGAKNEDRLRSLAEQQAESAKPTATEGATPE